MACSIITFISLHLKYFIWRRIEKWNLRSLHRIAWRKLAWRTEHGKDVEYDEQRRRCTVLDWLTSRKPEVLRRNRVGIAFNGRSRTCPSGSTSVRNARRYVFSPSFCLVILRRLLQVASSPPETGSPCIRIRDYRLRVRSVKLILARSRAPPRDRAS